MAQVQIIDVAPRDGLQSEHHVLPTATKVELIRRLAAAGVRSVEATSFVNPRKVPQMADAVEVIAGVKAAAIDVQQIGLALNVRGCERAIEAGVDEVGFVLVSTDTFSQRNQGAPVSQSIDVWYEIHALCRAANVRCNVLIASAFGCPFEGEVSADHVLGLADKLLACAPDTFGVADSIGVGVPVQMKAVIAPLAKTLGDIPLRCHLHDTRNTGIANALTAIDHGATQIDASTGGIGGCPFAPAATGNIATEDLLYALERSGIDGAVDLEKTIDTASWLAEQLGHDVPSSLLRAGGFPKKVA
ncbi:MAG: hydroxymethylglutaryl-CoA lyase [Gammaproteobacteria bacterium]